MTNTEGTGAPQPGWYPDPAGTTQRRWWDGTSWTEHLQAPAATVQPPASPPASPPVAAQPAAQAEPAYGTSNAAAPPQNPYAQNPYAQNPPAQNPYATSAPLQPNLGPNPAIYTPFIWVIVLLPLLSAIGLAAWNMGANFAAVGGYSAPLHNPMLMNPMLTDPMYIVVTLLGWVIYGVSVWMAYLDWRALGRIGIVRPFHWAWTFLGGIVYVIGRSVVVHRRLGTGGLLPIWISAGVLVITFVVVIVKVAMLVSSITSMYSF